MITYKDKDGASIRPGEPFELDGIAFPANWIELATKEDLARFNIERIEEPDPEPAPIPTPRELTLPEKLESIGVTIDDLKKALGLV